MITTKKLLDNINNTNIYSFILFALYKVRELPEYSSLSELAYILDEKSLLSICEYFGGQTIKIPTIDELKDMIYALVVYQKVNIERLDINDAIDSLPLDATKKHKIKSIYINILGVLDGYELSIQ